MEITKTGEGLKRVVGLPAFSMSIVNNSIGSGMFVLPAIVGIQLGAKEKNSSGACGKCIVKK